MIFEMVISCLLTFLIWFLIKKTVLKWLGEYVRFEQEEQEKGQKGEGKGEKR